MLHETVIALPRKDQVVEKGDPEDLPRLLEPAGDFHVLRRGLEAARGVVVADDDGAGAVDDGIGEDFPGVDDRRPYLISTLFLSQCHAPFGME